MCFLVLAVLQLVPESCGCCVVACRTSLSCTHPGSPAEAKPQAGGLQGAPWLHTSDLTELLETKPGSEQPALHLQGERKAVAARSKLLRLYLGKMLLIVVKQGAAPAGSFCLIQPKLALIAVLLYLTTSGVQVTSGELLTHSCSACSLLRREGAAGCFPEGSVAVAVLALCLARLRALREGTALPAATVLR